MKKSAIRRSVVLASALGAVLSPIVGPLTAAHAVVGPGITVVAAAGSDTTENFMTQLANVPGGYPNSSTTVKFYNIPANLPTGTNFTVPGDTAANGCAADTIWSRDPLAPTANTAPTKGVAPFGSTAGRNYLAAENGGTGPNPNAANGGGTTPTGTDFGCVDVARSSGTPRTSTTGDKLTFEYYAYAMDAVSWASTSVKSPATLTTQQLLDIYNCVDTNWNQVGGTAGAIQRYYPQPGSGTRDFFTTEVLGQPKTYVPPTKAQNAACPTDPIFIEENQGKTIATGDIDKAILPYSAGVWSNMESNRINPSLDLRKGALLKGITTGTAPSQSFNTPIQWVGGNLDYELDTAGVVNETNIKLNTPTPPYPGVRYVFNVLDNQSGRPGYVAAKGLFGFTNLAGGAKSPLCDNLNGSSTDSNNALAVLQSNSFAPLSTSDIGGHNVAGATCRLFNVTS